jgi:N-acetylmuramoyl-L-alanine amidase
MLGIFFYFKVKTTGNTTKIYLSSYPFDFVQYNNIYNTGIVNLSPGKETQYSVTTDPTDNSVNVVIPQDLKLESKRVDVNDNLIKYIDIGTQYQDGSKVTTASIKMQDSIKSEVLSAPNSKLIKIRFKRNITSLDQLTVVVDAGHGGQDPGASALDGTKEKNYNLDVALRLDKILKSLGFKTILTRSDDTFIELDGRTSMANLNYADFFMSIHFNAYNRSANGIETLYYPNSVNEDYSISNKQIADIFHSEIVGALGRASRGVTARPNLYVLNKTKMPAILAELGFITNPDELAQIETDAYREKAARALAVSIVKYFRDIQGVSIDIDLNSIYSWPYGDQTAQPQPQPAAPDQTLVQPDPTAQTTQDPTQAVTQDAATVPQN